MTLNDTGVNQEVGGVVNVDVQSNLDAQSSMSDIDSTSSVADDKGQDTDTKDADTKAAAKAADEEAKQLERFDKHPRFQELMKDRDALKLEIAELKGKVSVAPKAEVKEVIPYKDIAALTAEQIAEWQSDDPKGFAENLKAQAKYEAEKSIRNEIESRTRRESEQNAIKKTYEKFEKDNPDFRKMWDAGEIMAYMEQNPGHNPISAYREMTLEAKIAEATAKAKKEAEDEVTKRFQAKKKATVLTGGPGSVHVPVEEDHRFKDSKTHGGRTVVLAEKLAAMRRGAGK